MATITWLGPHGSSADPTSGDWDAAANWSGGALPSSDDTVELLGSGPEYDVVLATNPTIAALQLGAFANFTIYDEEELLISGSGTTSISGTIHGNGGIFFEGGATELTGASVSAGYFNFYNEQLAISDSVVTYLYTYNTDITVNQTNSFADLTIYGGSFLGFSTIEGAGIIRNLKSRNMAPGAPQYTGLSTTTIGGDVELFNSGALRQFSNVTLGDGETGSGKASVVNASTYELGGDFNLISGASGAVFENEGLLSKTIGSAKGVIGTVVVNAGTIAVSSGTLDLSNTLLGGAAGVSGSLDIEKGATMEFGGFVGPQQLLTFEETGDILLLDDARDFHASIDGFTSQQSIDLAGFVASSDKLHFTEASGGAGGYLLIASGSESANLFFSGSHQTTDFHVATDNHGGTLLTLAAS